MASARKTKETVRAPRQERSQKRVDQILEAARTIIAERGAAGLTIGEIAEVAGVTAGSMYQYFPGKAAVIYALAEQSIGKLDEITTPLFARKPRSHEAFAAMLAEFLDDYYQLFRTDPVVRDIWTGIGSDKSLNDLNRVATEQLLDQLLELAIPLVPHRDRTTLSNDLRLLLAFGDSATATALYLEETKARALIDRAKRMMMTLWLNMS